MNAICWAYNYDGRVCRKPATVLDPQRGFLVCPEHATNRETYINTQTNIPTEQHIMSTVKTKPPTNGAANAASEPRTYRINSEVESKIDDWIKQHPKDWTYIQAMPRDRLERTVVLNEVRQIDRQQRMREGIMKRINADPKLKSAYETLVKDVPEDQREEVMTQMARQKQRTVTRAQTQQQTKGEAVGV
jgi:hypothetical protein